MQSRTTRLANDALRLIAAVDNIPAEEQETKRKYEKRIPSGRDEEDSFQLRP